MSAIAPNVGTGAMAIALDLHARGYSLLPLEAHGKRPNAAVLTAVHGAAEWSGLRDRRASLPEIRAWFEHDSDANLGLIVTPGLVVVDVDHPEHFDLELPKTPTVRSTRGQHFYFAGDVHGVVKHPWGEVRGAESYVVAPPSVHASGHRYEWALGLDEAPLAALPGTLCPAEETRTPERKVPRSNVGPRDVRSPGHDAEAVETFVWDSSAVRAALTLMGRPEAISPKGRTREFRCLLPDHRDRRESAGLYRNDAGSWRYKCHGCDRNLSLARLFAAVRSGIVDGLDSMSAPTACRWLARLAHQSGVATVPRTEVDLPSGRSRNPRILAEGFALLSDLRTAHGDLDPVPYSWRFAAAWCGLSERQARDGLAELRLTGWLTPTGPSAPGVGFTYPCLSPCASQRNDSQAAPVVAEHVDLPDGARPLETARLVVGVQPRDERGEVRAMHPAEVVAVFGAPSASRSRARPVAKPSPRDRHTGKPTPGRSGRDPLPWRFGIGQTAAQEAAEIRAVQRAGLTEVYMAAQAGARRKREPVHRPNDGTTSNALEVMVA